MKILLEGSARHMAVEWHYVRYLKELGADVCQHSAYDTVFHFHTRNLFNKILFRLGWKTLYPRVNKELIKLAHEYKPDVIWVFKGMEIFPDTVKQLAKDFIIVNYNPDHPFEFASKGSGNKNVSDAISFYNCYLTYSDKIAAELKERYGVPSGQLCFGYEYSDAVFQKAMTAPEINRCCFIGNPDNIRKAHVEALLQSGLPVDVYGHGWDGFFSKGQYPQLQVFDAVYGDDFWIRARQYRVQLNVFRPHNEASHNMRSFELPGIGAIQLAPRSPEHERFFEEGKEIFLFNDYKEMIEKAQHLLQLSANEALHIRNAALQRSIASKYSYKNRAEEVLKRFEGLMTGAKNKKNHQ
jgi:spore maturation protein CgeB